MPPTPTSQPPQLLDQVKHIVRLKHLSPRIESSYLYYIRDFIIFHNKRHSKDMGTKEFCDYLTHLFEYRQITICDGKGAVDRITMLPLSLVEPLQEQLRQAKLLHQQDLTANPVGRHPSPRQQTRIRWNSAYLRLWRTGPLGNPPHAKSDRPLAKARSHTANP
ncbi:MAG: phage integrase N-terminal SAM-like domain-containing protein [Thermosynechococcaceae cyanobacterium]